MFNSREFQAKKEGLYLTALLLTQERFSFAAQFFAMETIAGSTAGSNVTTLNAAGGRRRNSWAYGTTGGVGKLFSTGALLLAQFANTTAVNLGNLAGTTPARVISQSAISFDVVQPFLRGGGRAVTLEPLTQTERNVVYAVRDLRQVPPGVLRLHHRRPGGVHRRRIGRRQRSDRRHPQHSQCFRSQFHAAGPGPGCRGHSAPACRWLRARPGSWRPIRLLAPPPMVT